MDARRWCWAPECTVQAEDFKCYCWIFLSNAGGLHMCKKSLGLKGTQLQSPVHQANLKFLVTRVCKCLQMDLETYLLTALCLSLLCPQRECTAKQINREFRKHFWRPFFTERLRMPPPQNLLVMTLLKLGCFLHTIPSPLTALRP